MLNRRIHSENMSQREFNYQNKNGNFDNKKHINELMVPGRSDD